VGVVTGVLGWAVAPAQGVSGCVTEGDSDELTLLLGGIEPFDLEYANPVKVRVTFSDRSTPTVETIGSAVTVEALGSVVHHLRTPASLERGMLFVNETARLSDVRYRNGVIRASIPMDPELVAKQVRLPCDVLLVGRPAEGHAPLHEPNVAVVGMARARRGSLAVYEAPKPDAAHLSLEPVSVTFDILERHRRWVRIAWEGGTGRVQGWTPSTDVRTVGTDGFLAGTGIGIGCCGAYSLAKNATRRVAALKAGASIHASPGGTRWGIAQAEVAEVEVEDVPQKEWLRLLKNPAIAELACEPRRTWVRRSSLQFDSAPHADGGAVEPHVAADAAARRR